MNRKRVGAVAIKILTAFAKVWVFLAAIFVVGCFIDVWYFKGISGPVNPLTIAVVFSPAVISYLIVKLLD